MPATPLLRSIVLATACAALAACAGRDTPPTEVSTGQTPIKVAEVGGLSVPESARYDDRRDVWYVSNINGDPFEADGNGFITRIRGDFGTVDTLWVAGGVNDVVLDAPKGMAVVGDTLWVADITAMRGINVLDGSLVASVPVPEAVYLNDVTYGTDGSLYITDTGLERTTTGTPTPGPGRVFRLTGREVAEVLRFADGSGPNGIAVDMERGNLLIVAVASPTIYRWTVGEPVADSVASGTGGYHGVVVLADGRVLISSWADSTVQVLDGATLSPLIRDLPSPADLGVDTMRGHLAVPLFAAGRVEFWTIPLR